MIIILQERDSKTMEYIKEVFAQYHNQCIQVYQAYNPVIAKEAVTLQTFFNTTGKKVE